MTRQALLSTTAMTRVLGQKPVTNDAGYRIGESHHNAKLTDQEVEEIRDLFEGEIFSYAELAREYGSTKATIAAICKYRRRNHTPHVEAPTRRR